MAEEVVVVQVHHLEEEVRDPSPASSFFLVV